MIGRSGTGKTSIIMQRMLHIEREGRRAKGGQLPRQLFLTASKKLTTRTEKNFREISAIELDSRGPRSFLPHSLSDLQQEHFPLFLTLDQFLKMLDGCLDKPFFDRKADGALSNENVGTGLAWEQDVDAEVTKVQGGAKARSQKPFEVNFSNFLTHFWRTMRSGSTTKVSPSVVFQEIITSIKGASYIDGLGTAGSRGRPLTREQYIGLPAKVGSFASSNEAFTDKPLTSSDKHGSREQVGNGKCHQRLYSIPCIFYFVFVTPPPPPP
jgi:hypothetical protein